MNCNSTEVTMTEMLPVYCIGGPIDKQLVNCEVRYGDPYPPEFAVAKVNIETQEIAQFRYEQTIYGKHARVFRYTGVMDA